jgi:cytochrome c551/c552
VLFAALLFPAGFAGWAVGHYTSLGKSSATVVHTVTVGSTSTPTTTSAPTTTSGGTTTSSGGGGSAAAGEAVFSANGCGSCHTFKPANSTGTIGPDLDKVLKGKDKAFIHESISDPNKDIAPGFQADIMPQTFGQSLSPDQLKALVDYLSQVTQ